MSDVLVIARKELRAYFLSPVALVFLSVFLLASLFCFFWIEGFFARGIADARPLFAWLPVLLALLVPALGMRLWAEEERAGTVELLRTLPLRTWQVVLGKYLSGLALVALALALTLPVPITVELLGDLDWGPVVGGYLATLLLAGAYLSITLCVSARTVSSMVALMGGVLACGLLAVIGSEPVVAFFPHAAGELLRALGAGARFDSILRGVLDLRDLLYFASLAGFFFALNVLLLDSKRWSGSPRRAREHREVRLAVALLGLNLVALSLLLAPVRGARVDLTEDDEYSVSTVTRGLLEGLDEPLLIRGYFSGRTHPLLAPLVPRIRDLAFEYGALGGDRVTVEFVDPSRDEAAEREAGQVYGIRPFPFQFADRHEASVVNSYFHLLVRYGDQVEVLDFDDLIEVDVVGMDVDVRLRNLEYDLTRAVQKAVYGFQSVESVFARLPAEAHLTAVISAPEALPEGFGDAPSAVDAVARELQERSDGRFTWERVDPDAEDTTLDREAAYDRYGLQPLSVSLFSDDSFYLHLLLQVGDRVERLVLDEAPTEAAVREALVASLKRAGPGALKTAGLFIGGPGDAPPPQVPGMPSQGGRGLGFDTLRELLGQTWRVTDVDLADGRVPDDVDVLFVVDPRELEEPAVRAIDAFLMRGGSVVVAGGTRVMEPDPYTGQVDVATVRTGLEGWLAHKGVELEDGLVLDARNAAFPVPVSRDLGGFRVREIQMLRYPAFPDVRADGLADDHPAVSGLAGVIAHWSSPLVLKEDEGLPERQALLTSSPASWVVQDFDPNPSFELYPELGWRAPPEGELEPQVLAVSAVGPFDSFFDTDGTPPEEGEEVRATGGRLARSPEHARLVVLGSASFLSDEVVGLSRRVSDAWLGNFELASNLADWSVEDIDLLKIRSRGHYARVLEPTSAGLRRGLEWANYGLALLAVVAVGAGARLRRRRVVPLFTDERPRRSHVQTKGAA